MTLSQQWSWHSRPDGRGVHRRILLVADADGPKCALDALDGAVDVFGVVVLLGTRIESVNTTISNDGRSARREFTFVETP